MAGAALLLALAGQPGPLGLGLGGGDGREPLGFGLLDAGDPERFGFLFGLVAAGVGGLADGGVELAVGQCRLAFGDRFLLGEDLLRRSASARDLRRWPGRSPRRSRPCSRPRAGTASAGGALVGRCRHHMPSDQQGEPDDQEGEAWARKDVEAAPTRVAGTPAATR